MPNKECTPTSEDPCDLFHKMSFPVNEGEGGCGCGRDRGGTEQGYGGGCGCGGSAPSGYGGKKNC